VDLTGAPGPTRTMRAVGKSYIIFEAEGIATPEKKGGGKAKENEGGWAQAIRKMEGNTV